MRNIKLILIPVITYLLVSLSSCSGSTYDGNEYIFIEGNEVKFTSTISDPNTTEIATQWKSGDKVGISMMRSTTNLILNDFRNIKYGADPSGALTPDNTPILFSEDTDYKHDFVAYYPYQENLANFIYNIDLRDQADQSKLVLMYGKTLEIKNTASSVNIDFSQKLTKLVFNITPGVGFTEADLAGIKTELIDINSLADFNLATGQIGRQRENQTVAALVSNNGKKAEAIVIPNEDTRIKVKLTLKNNVNFEWTSPLLTLEEATKYTYNITVGTNMIEVSEGSITSWTGIDEAPIEGEGKPDDTAKYKVGDYYPDETNPIGVVFEVSNGGKSGKLVSLTYEFQQRWGGIQNESENGLPAAADTDNGDITTRDIINGRKNWGNFASDYVIFEWMYNTVNGGDIDGKWYLPAKNELKSLYAGTSGLTYADIKDTWLDNQPMPDFNSESCTNARNAFNTKLTDAGGIVLHQWAWYWTSTEVVTGSDVPNKTAWSVQFDTGVMQSIKIKWDWGRARPIMKF